MRLLVLLAFCGWVWAQNMVVPLASVAALSHFLEQNTHQIWVIGDLPVRGLEGALRGKQVRLITGSTQVQGLTWLRGLDAQVRVLPGKLNAAFLLADGRYFLVSEPKQFTLLSNEEVVAVIQQRLHLNELWTQARPWRP